MSKYVVVHGRGQATIVASNISEAYEKAKRMYPRCKLITVSRAPSRKGKEYETYIISR